MRVLIVEDEGKIAGFLAQAFQEEFYEAAVVGDGESALALIRGESFDLVVLDVMEILTRRG